MGRYIINDAIFEADHDSFTGNVSNILGSYDFQVFEK